MKYILTLYIIVIFAVMLVSCATTTAETSANTIEVSADIQTNTPVNSTLDTEIISDSFSPEQVIPQPLTYSKPIDENQKKIVGLSEDWQDLTVYCWDASLNITVGRIAYCKQWSDKSKIRVSSPLLHKKTRLNITMYPFDDQPLYDYTFSFVKTEAGAELVSIESAYGRINRTNEIDVIENVFQSLEII